MNPADRLSPADDAPVAAAQPERRARLVHRAAEDLRRGTPVLLRGAAPLVILPAETAGPRGLSDLQALAAAAPVLLLAPTRAATLLGTRPVEAAAVAFRTGPALLTPSVLLGLADPTAAQMLPDRPQPAGPPPALAAAALALAKLARLLPAVLAAPARDDALLQADLRGLLAVDAADVLAHPAAAALGLRRVAEVPVPLEDAPDARLVAFRAPDAGIEHMAIVVGRPDPTAPVLVRIHSECFTGDLLGSLRCDCGPQLRGAIARMAAGDGGVLLYLAQEGRGIGLMNKLRAYAMQDRGLDTLDANRALGWGADERNFLVAATMLRELGIDRVRLLTNNPDKVAALRDAGLRFVEREAHAIAPNGVNNSYLTTKKNRFGHMLDAEGG